MTIRTPVRYQGQYIWDSANEVIARVTNGTPDIIGQQIADALNGELEAKLASAVEAMRGYADRCDQCCHVRARHFPNCMVMGCQCTGFESRAAQWLEENV